MKYEFYKASWLHDLLARGFLWCILYWIRRKKRARWFINTALHWTWMWTLSSIWPGPGRNCRPPPEPGCLAAHWTAPPRGSWRRCPLYPPHLWPGLTSATACTPPDPSSSPPSRPGSAASSSIMCYFINCFLSTNCAVCSEILWRLKAVAWVQRVGFSISVWIFCWLCSLSLSHLSAL